MNKKLSHFASIFPVKDALASANWYKNKLGFSFEFQWGEPVYYTIVHRDEAVSIHFTQAENLEEIQPNRVYIFCYDVDALYSELKSNGVTEITKPQDYEYEMRDFEVTDPDGHVLIFGMSTERLNS